MSKTPAPTWQDNVIEVVAPRHTVMCFACLEPIPAGTVFDVVIGRPYHHTQCPTWTPTVIEGDGPDQLTLDIAPTERHLTPVT